MSGFGRDRLAHLSLSIAERPQRQMRAERGRRQVVEGRRLQGGREPRLAEGGWPVMTLIAAGILAAVWPVRQANRLDIAARLAEG